jgi:hypothetical protein
MKTPGFKATLELAECLPSAPEAYLSPVRIKTGSRLLRAERLAYRAFLMRDDDALQKWSMVAYVLGNQGEHAMKLPIKTVVLPDWQKVCEALEKNHRYGAGLYLECRPEETRALYIWAKKNRAYRIGYRAKGDGVLITIKERAA